MKRKISFVIPALAFILCFSQNTMAQESLPGFTLKDMGKGRVQISWLNSFTTCVQLAIQRSYDSTQFFRTIFSAQSPSLPQNGYIDNLAPRGTKSYYRIFYVLEGGAYFFSTSKSLESLPASPDPAKNIPMGMFISIFKDSFLVRLSLNEYRRFRDSITDQTKDTLVIINSETVQLKPFAVKPLWKPSVYVFTTDNGYVSITLPLVKQHRYKIIFFEENGTELFQVKQVKEEQLLLDKTNFLHAGWFNFELFEDDKVKEKGKFYLQKDF